MTTELLHCSDRERRGELIASNDRTRVSEALITVNDAAEVNASFLVSEQLSEGRLLNNNGKSRRSNNVSETSGLCCFNIGVQRRSAEYGARELADFLATYEVRLSGRILTPLNLWIDHAFSLQSAPRGRYCPGRSARIQPTPVPSSNRFRARFVGNIQVERHPLE